MDYILTHGYASHITPDHIFKTKDDAEKFDRERSSEIIMEISAVEIQTATMPIPGGFLDDGDRQLRMALKVLAYLVGKAENHELHEKWDREDAEKASAKESSTTIDTAPAAPPLCGAIDDSKEIEY